MKPHEHTQTELETWSLEDLLAHMRDVHDFTPTAGNLGYLTSLNYHSQLHAKGSITVRPGLIAEQLSPEEVDRRRRKLDPTGDWYPVGSLSVDSPEPGRAKGVLFRRELAALINKYSLENGSNTPDFLLAQFLVGCLEAWEEAVPQRDKWYGVKLVPGDHDRQVDGEGR